MASESQQVANLIRPAIETEAPVLTELALRSKGYWKYDPQFLSDCRAELTITPDYVSANVIFVIEEKGTTVGFYSLEKTTGMEVELVNLFVEPHAIGKGYGSLLMQHATATARRMGFRAMTIKSDPYAESFYVAMGATRVGEIASSVRPDRMLPLLRYDLS